MKARGDVTVDFVWKEGKVVSYKLHSSVRKRVAIRVNGVMKEVETEVRK